MKYFFLIAGLIFVVHAGRAQQFLQLEKRGSLKTYRYYTGDEIAFMLDGQWYRRTIDGLDVDRGWLKFGDGTVPISGIMQIRLLDPSVAVSLSNLVWAFGAGWLVFSAIDGLVTGTYEQRGLTVPPTAAATGGILRLFHKPKKRIGERWRLRMLDLTMPAEQ
jgi:hypothetical protein